VRLPIAADPWSASGQPFSWAPSKITTKRRPNWIRHVPYKKIIAMTALLALAEPASAAALKIVNKTREPIAEVQISHGSGWGPPQLDGKPIRFGESRTLRWVADGKRRLMLKNAGGDECILDGIDFEEGTVLTVTDRDHTLCK
jgi:hypothetical protein